MSTEPWDTSRPLLGWLDTPRCDHGLRVLGQAWEPLGYDELAARVFGASAALAAAGVARDDVVAVTADDSVRFMTGFFGALHAGATPLPLAPPTLLGERYVAHVATLFAAARPTAAITTDATADATAEALRRADLPAALLTEIAEAGPARASDPARLALVQFTSGSTGTPRPVEVSWANLEANIAMIRRWLRWTDDDAVASWLPLYHDMGLIGCFLSSVCSQTDTWLMRPEQFVARPTAWLECFGVHGATLTASPNFGYAYAARRVRTDALQGSDFSGWRAAIVGAERLDLRAMSAFADLTAPFGFDPATFRPAYGLAEATLAVTGHPLGSSPRHIGIDWAGLRTGAPVRVTDGPRSLVAGVGEEATAARLVACGAPLAGQEVTVVDDDGRPLPPGHLGGVVVEGPCVATGYRTAGRGASAIDQGRLSTGDAGFLLDGELYVLGRLTDSFTVRGRQVYAEGVEASICEDTGLPVHKCVVTPAHRRDGVEIVVVVEAAGTDWVEAVAATVRRQVGNTLAVRIYAGRKAIPRTTSGKPRRRVLAETVAAARLDAELVFSWSPGQPLAMSGAGSPHPLKEES
jgi:acyl-CoA synthetase (AMP-forming)/AMP-acid ligase II